MKIISMKRTKQEKKKAEGAEGPTIGSGGDIDPYPYGLSINLEKESMDKLGLDINDFQIGGKVEMTCVAEVTGMNQSVSKSNDRSSISLQITDIGMGECKSMNPKKLKDAIKSLNEMKEK